MCHKIIRDRGSLVCASLARRAEDFSYSTTDSLDSTHLISEMSRVSRVEGATPRAREPLPREGATRTALANDEEEEHLLHFFGLEPPLITVHTVSYPIVIVWAVIARHH